VNYRSISGLMVFACMCFLTACGGGGGGGGGADGSALTPSSPHAPVISSLTYSPSSPIVNTGVQISGSFYASDSGGDMSLLTMIVFDQSGNEVGRNTSPLGNAAGVNQGLIYWHVTTDSTEKGTFALEVVVTDLMGARSNTLTTNFTLLEPFAVSSTNPGADATNIDPSSPITVTFNKELDPSTISSSLTVSNNLGPVPGAVSHTDKSVTFTPTGNIFSNGSYNVSISSSLRDVDGLSIGNYSFHFTAGSGMFFPYSSIPTGSMPRAVAIGDINGDGRNDVVMVTHYNADAENDFKLFVFLQNAAGGLEPPLKYSTNGGYNNPLSVAVGDVNHDGRNDIVVTAANIDMEVFLQNASGGLDPKVSHPATDLSLVEVADIDNDGRLDIIGVGSSTVFIWRQAQDGTLAAPVTITTTGGDDICVSDLNNDGLPDIAVLSGTQVQVLTQKPDHTFDPPVSYADPGDPCGFMATGDINGDGLNDIVVASQVWVSPNGYIGRAAVFLQNQQGTLSSPLHYASYYSPQPVRIADVNNDGRQDLIVLHGGAAPGVYVQSVDGALKPEWIYSGVGSIWLSQRAVAVGDINGDGLKDIVAAGQGKILLFLHK
jgi:hypothetical protein